MQRRTVQTDRGESLTLSTERRDRLGIGGQGQVFRTTFNGGSVAAKIFATDQRLEDERLRVLQRLEPRCARLATLPIRILYDDASGSTGGGSGARRPIGYLMRWIDPASSLSAVRLSNFREIERLQRFTWQDAVLAALRLAESVAALHRLGIVIGDLNSENVVFEQQPSSRGRSTWRAVLLDSDSFQVRGEHGRLFPCPVSRPPTTAPELVGVDLARVERQASADDFALAVLIHQILLHDHPYDNAIYPRDPELPVSEKIRRGLYPHAAIPIEGLSSAPCRPVPHQISEEMDAAFRRSFHPSGDHPCAGIRPTAASWAALLRNLHASLVRCKVSPHHHHPRDRPCLWCAVDQAVGTPISRFPFGRSAAPADATPLDAVEKDAGTPTHDEDLEPHIRRCRRLQPLHPQLIDRLLRLARAQHAFREVHADPEWLLDRAALQRRIDARNTVLRRLLPIKGRQLERQASLDRLVAAASAISSDVCTELDAQDRRRRRLLDSLASLSISPLEAVLLAPALRQQRIAERQERWIHEQLQDLPIRSWGIEGIGDKRHDQLEAHGLRSAAELRLGLDRITAIPGFGIKLRQRLEQHLQLVLAELRQRVERRDWSEDPCDVVPAEQLLAIDRLDSDLQRLQHHVDDLELAFQGLSSGVKAQLQERDQLLEEFEALFR